MTNFTTDRRSIVKGAAWAVPAISVAAAAPSLAASSLEYTTITKSFVYSVLDLFDIGVEVTASQVPVDVHPGVPLDPISVTSTVTIPANLVPIIKGSFLGGATHVSGTSVSVSTLSGAYDATTSTDLTIPLTLIPDSGPLQLVASGTGVPTVIAAGTAPGTVTITMGDPASVLTGRNADGSENGSTYNSNLDKKTGNDYTLATFTIH